MIIALWLYRLETLTFGEFTVDPRLPAGAVANALGFDERGKDVERGPFRVPEATLHLKGVTLRAKDASRDLNHSVNLVAEELGRQVKRHRDKRRKRREQRAAAASPQLPPDAAGGQLPAM